MSIVISEKLIGKDQVEFWAKRNLINKKEWRLVYRDGKVKDFFESEGYTWTIYNLFCGTEEECIREFEKLKLEYNPGEG
jgi:hypothetical protein